MYINCVEVHKDMRENSESNCVVSNAKRLFTFHLNKKV